MRLGLPRRLLRRADRRVPQPRQAAGREVAVQVHGLGDLAVAQDDLQLGELGAGVRKLQARNGVAQVVEGEVRSIGGAAGRGPGACAGPTSPGPACAGARLDAMRAEIASWQTEPVTALCFGSFARGEGDEDSDVDLLLVRPSDRPTVRPSDRPT